jgi:REP element-mobilizing transposase RayT
MARKPRIHLPGGFYHVILRGNNRQNIFLSDNDRLFWESVIAKMSKDTITVFTPIAG